MFSQACVILFTMEGVPPGLPPDGGSVFQGVCLSGAFPILQKMGDPQGGKWETPSPRKENGRPTRKKNLRPHSKLNTWIWSRILYGRRSVTSYMLLCVTGFGSHLVRVLHNSHTLHVHIHIFQCFLVLTWSKLNIFYLTQKHIILFIYFIHFSPYIYMSRRH